MNYRTQNALRAIQKRAIQNIAVNIVLLLVGYVTVAAGLSGVPSSAFAAELVTSISLPATAVRSQQRHSQRMTTQCSLHRRCIYARRSGMRKVMFTPIRPSFGRAFALHETSDALALRSSVAYVIDQQTNASLFEKNSQAVLPIASISKLMSAMVALDAQRPLDEILQITNEDRDTEKGTYSRLTVGSRLSREDMLHIALMASENRAAAALSRYYPGGRPAFIAAMNEKARALGMTDTYFADPTGLTSLNVSSARDLAKMVNAAYQYSLIRRFSTDTSYSVFTGKKSLAYRNTNALIRSSVWHEIGLQKTGFTNEAGECLVMQATVQNRPVIIVLLDSTGKYSRFGDAQRIRGWLNRGGMQRIISADAGAANR